MKAAICHRYGPPEVVRILEVPKPVPGDDDVLVRTRATTVNSGDARLRAANVPRRMGVMFRLGMGILGPRLKTMGFEVAGDVEAVGRNVSGLKPGDRVLASNGFRLGGHAEYFRVAGKGLAVPIPDVLSYEEAAALQFGGVTSLVFFEAGKLRPGQSILINGASGAVGVLAIQIARALGAHVTAVCSRRNGELMRDLGAETVIDYAKTDIAGLAERFDVIMDTHGNAPFAHVGHLLKPGGRFLMVIGTLWEMISGRFNPAIVTAGTGDSAFKAETVQRLLDMTARREIRPVVGMTLPFERIVDAYRLVDTGHKVGSLVLTFP